VIGAMSVDLLMTHDSSLLKRSRAWSAILIEKKSKPTYFKLAKPG
jgi:hypothetical protein